MRGEPACQDLEVAQYVQEFAVRQGIHRERGELIERSADRIHGVVHDI